MTFILRKTEQPFFGIGKSKKIQYCKSYTNQTRTIVSIRNTELKQY